MSARRVETGVAALCAAALALSCTDGGGARVGAVVTVAASDASNPTVAVGPDGTYYVAWVGGQGGSANVWLARSEDGARFSEPVRVNHIDGDAAAHEQAPAQVAAAPDGNVYVVWQNATHVEGRRFPYSDLRLARSVDGGRTFEPALTVNDDAGGPPSSHTFHDVVTSTDGTVVVSWIDGRVRGAAERALAARTAAGADAGDAAGAGHSPDPALPGSEIRVAVSTDAGRSFPASEVVAREACPCCRTALAVGPGGERALAWRDVDADNVRDIVVARSAGGTFGPAEPVHADGWRIDGCPHAGPSIAYDAAGRTHVTWYTGAPGAEGLYYAVAPPGGEFGAPHALIAGEWLPVSQAKLAATADAVFLAWDDRRDDAPAIRLAVARDGGAPHVLGSTFTGTSPAIDASADAAGVAWLDGASVKFAKLTR